MNLPEDPEKPSQINIVPMIDVIFAVLAFFILSTLFLTRSEGLPVNLPGAVTANQQRSPDLTLTIDAQGNLFLDQEAIALSNLTAAVESQTEAGQPVLVTINADAAVDHGRVVAAMDELRKIDQVRLGIATQPSD
ncbi:MAG: biopolymer transporter ExbD [Leptolyngbya sp. SIO4C5]|uniref:ExbD/TolR family protein n=1 Tax=Sphaerothrix gracilis TaxID=3151835 RepID=UPI0013BF516B|nr:biopolymer transporter ExbD [Leptolyngbya sp. SIO4C5]